ncbi:MAG TPA: hypothetical protein VFG32_08870, partial [Bacteroidota bacterium]|nr:hypothetical protein [Bacteroidota bacterium]
MVIHQAPPQSLAVSEGESISALRFHRKAMHFSFSHRSTDEIAPNQSQHYHSRALRLRKDFFGYFLSRKESSNNMRFSCPLLF